MLACMDGLLVFSKIAHQPLPYVLPLLIYCLSVPPFYRLASFLPAASTIWLQYNLLRTSSVSRQQYRLWWRTKPEAPQYQPIPQPTHQVARVCKDISLRSSGVHCLPSLSSEQEFAKRAFRRSAPSVWNSLPTSITWCDSLPMFKLKPWFHVKIKLFGRILGLHGTTSEMK